MHIIYAVFGTSVIREGFGKIATRSIYPSIISLGFLHTVGEAPKRVGHGDSASSGFYGRGIDAEVSSGRAETGI
jgi:hypothetical protein